MAAEWWERDGCDPVTPAQYTSTSTFVRLTNVPLGFGNRNVAVATILLLAEQYRDPIFRDVFFRELTQRAEAVPGLLGSTVATSLPPGGNISSMSGSNLRSPPQSVAGIIGFNYV